MLTIRNRIAHDRGIRTIKDRAAHLVQAMENCPIGEIIHALIVFDQSNSPGAKSPNAKRCIYQFAGLESDASGKGVDGIIDILNNGDVVHSKSDLMKLLDGYPHAT